MNASSFRLDKNADAVEFCPHESFRHILAAASYTLEEGDRPNRSGSVSLFSVDDDLRLNLINQVETVGIFDLKWNPPGNFDPVLAVADADGCLSIHTLINDLDSQVLTLKESSKEKVNASMCLCVDWSPSATSLSTGLSDGSTSLLSIREDKLQLTESWRAHQYEVWSTCFDSHDHLLYTGSDDCCFNGWDLRAGPSSPVFKNSKAHKGGVCCVASSKFDSTRVLTGSYDECLRVWDIRVLARPVKEVELGLGGGVWRLKPNKEVPGLVLAACMHNGFAVVEMGRETGPLVVERWMEHESLAYGADWKMRENGKGRMVATTCSFYDRLVMVWSPKVMVDNFP